MSPIEIMTIDAQKLKRMTMLHVMFALIDVRSRDDFEKGHIKNAFNFSSELAIEKIRENFKKIDTPIVLYDNGESLSRMVATELEKLGYMNVVVLEGGYAEYLKST
ncbi:MAG: rhodanese-like domain-containing protein [Oligoflexia bacterium]|nr:rhodanese-like domain-containing protein [Oligoflexia bacterium]